MYALLEIVTRSFGCAQDDKKEEIIFILVFVSYLRFEVRNCLLFRSPFGTGGFAAMAFRRNALQFWLVDLKRGERVFYELGPVRL